MKKVVLTALTAGLALAVMIGAQTIGAGHGKSRIKADVLSGYQEVSATNAGLSSKGTGEFKAEIDDDNDVITWELTYTGLAAQATQAHIHFGNRYLSGGVSVFFCGAPPNTPCPLAPAGVTEPVTITGTWTPASVVGPVTQGIAAGEWDEFVAAIRAGMTYANIHNSVFPAGEIRAQVNNKGQEQPA